MRYWLNLAAFHIERRDDISLVLSALRCALAHANAEGADGRAKRASIMRAMNYCRAIVRLAS